MRTRARICESLIVTDLMISTMTSQKLRRNRRWIRALSATPASGNTWTSCSVITAWRWRTT